MSENNAYQDLKVRMEKKRESAALRGLSVYTRDCTLTREQASKYRVGEVLLEPAVMEASADYGGMAASHRFAILSDHMDFSAAAPDGPRPSGFFAHKNSHFRVMDIDTCEGKTQILLLHLPEDKRWKKPVHLEPSLEQNLIQRCREDFQESLHAPFDPAPALTDRRGIGPVGMDANGQFYDPDPDLDTMFQYPIGQTLSMIRSWNGRFVCFRFGIAALCFERAYFHDEEPYDILLTYCCTSRTGTMSCHVLALCRTSGKKLIPRMLPEEDDIILDLEEIFKYKAPYLSEDQVDFDLPFDREEMAGRLNRI